MELALESAEIVSPAIATELIELSGLNLDPYMAVGSKISDRQDDFPSVREKLVAPDVFGILMGSPVYMGLVSSPLKQLFERMLAFRQGGFPLQNKVGGAIAVGAGRNTGVKLILQQLIRFMLSPEMILVGEGKPGEPWGGTMQSQGNELSKDEGSLNTFRGVGKLPLTCSTSGGPVRRLLAAHDPMRSVVLTLLAMLQWSAAESVVFTDNETNTETPICGDVVIDRPGAARESQQVQEPHILPNQSAQAAA